MEGSFFVVFDTCTHSAYYDDVHQVLASPEGAVIRYEYKRRLWQDDAASAFDLLVQGNDRLPRPVLLVYGEKEGFTHGDRDPDTMLTAADSVFIPTRSAELVGAAVVPGATALEDVLYLHLRLRGFLAPDAEPVRALVSALEAGGSLPFGVGGKWISLLPPTMAARAAEFISDDQEAWPAVVDAFVRTPTQFENDVFWRIVGVFEERNGASADEIQLVDRVTNDEAHPDRYHRDYPLKEGNRYLVTVQTHAPEGHGAGVPGGSSIAMTSRDDVEALLRLSSDPLKIVPNQVASQRFSIAIDAAVDVRFTGASLETQVPDHSSQYAAGSTCSLTFSIEKAYWRVLIGVASFSVATGLGGYVAGARPDGWTSGVLATIAALATALSVWSLSRQLKLTK